MERRPAAPDSHDFRAVLEQRERRVERRLCLLRVSVTLVGCFADGLTAAHAGSYGSAAILVGTGIGYSALVGWIALLLGRDPYRRWLKYALTLIDFSLLAAASTYWMRSGLLPLPAGELAASMMLMIPVVNLLSGMRVGRPIVAFSTACALATTWVMGQAGQLAPVIIGYNLGTVAVSGILALVISSSTTDLFLRFVRRNALTRFLPKQLVDRVDQGELSLELGGTDHQVTILMSDIRGFTTLSETRTPAQVVAQLNEYFTAMSEVIFAHGGSIDKYIGDAILAVFGIPSAGAEDARQALAAARAMLDRLDGLNADWSRRGLPTLRIGIGLHTGVAVAGNIGAPQRMEFTVIGDTVNVASRIEGLTKTYDTPLLFSETTLAAAGDALTASLVDEAPIRGRQGTIRLYTAGLSSTAPGARAVSNA